MEILTEDAQLTCEHRTGKVQFDPFQNFVTIESLGQVQRILRQVPKKGDPEPPRTITLCSNVGPTIKPCTWALPAYQGYSKLVFIEDIPVCLKTLTGLTDGTPPGMIKYKVDKPGQDFVESDA